MTSPVPLYGLIGVTQGMDAALTNLLIDAATEAAARIITFAGKDGVGAAVRRAQYAQVRAELLKTAEGLYQGAGATLVQSAAAAGQAAAAAATQMDNVLFQEFGQTLPPGLAAAHRAQAQNTIDNYIARTANGIPLSDQVYKTQRLSSGFIDQQINRSILLGESWKELADRVKSSIEPNVRGGVAYAAKRLGRTEINNAFHTAQINAHMDEPWVNGYRWNLSGSHPKPDTCDEYADQEHFEGGPAGVYKKGDTPMKPHPQCLCYITAETDDEDAFVNGFLHGKYDQYLDQKVYGLAPPSARPC